MMLFDLTKKRAFHDDDAGCLDYRRDLAPSRVNHPDHTRFGWGCEKDCRAKLPGWPKGSPKKWQAWSATHRLWLIL